MTYTVVLDTCTLYPAYLRDTLLRLAEAGLYRPLWSADILQELKRNLAALDSVGPQKAGRIISLIRKHFEDAEVTGYRPLIDTMTNDPADRHVLAAAVRANAAAVVTFNLDDFPPEATEPYGVDMIDPDAFLIDQLTLSPAMVMDTLRAQADAHSRPPRTLDGLLDALTKAGVGNFAGSVHARLPST